MNRPALRALLPLSRQDIRSTLVGVLTGMLLALTWTADPRTFPARLARGLELLALGEPWSPPEWRAWTRPGDEPWPPSVPAPEPEILDHPHVANARWPRLVRESDLCSTASLLAVRSTPPACPFDAAPADSLSWVQSDLDGPALDAQGEPLWIGCGQRAFGWTIELISVGPDRIALTSDDESHFCGRLTLAWPGLQPVVPETPIDPPQPSPASAPSEPPVTRSWMGILVR